MLEEKRAGKLPHSLILEDRKKLTLSGVTDVQRVEEREVSVETCQGHLLIKGSGLHMNKFCVETGDLSVEGQIDSLVYSENKATQGGFYARLFR